MIALLIRGCTLPGAAEGLKFLFIPKFEKLMTLDPWRKAAEQMFFSLGISWGGLMVFGSYNKFNNRIDIDAAVVSSLDFFTSLIASCVIFSVLGEIFFFIRDLSPFLIQFVNLTCQLVSMPGFLSTELGVPVDKVAEGGQGLAFVVYPEALSRLPLPWLWGILFFFMLFLLGLDSEFALLETALTALYDGFPKSRNHKVS